MFSLFRSHTLYLPLVHRFVFPSITCFVVFALLFLIVSVLSIVALYLSSLFLSCTLSLALFPLSIQLDNFVHVAGFIAGIALGLVLMRVDMGVLSDPHRWIGDLVMSCATVFLVIWFAAGASVVLLECASPCSALT